MQKGKIFLGLVLSLVILSNIFLVSALTAKIGNARAIVTAEVGDTLSRTIKVINDNNVSIVINILPTGDLAEDITMIDNDFTIAPGSFKEARYEVYVSKAGTTESHLNVRFTPAGYEQKSGELGNGVGITSTLIVKAGGEDDGLFGGIFNQDDNGQIITGSAVENTESPGLSAGILWIIILVLILIALAVIFFYLKKRSGSKEGKPTKTKKNVRKS